jgi:hypothetical protein
VQKGLLDDEDKMKLQAHPANAVIEMNALGQGQKIGDVLQAHEGPRIANELYDNGPALQDVQLVVGSQEANMGGTSGATATEVSVAEGSRSSSIQSNVDDLDDFLSDLARSAGQILMTEMTRETVTKIAGPGAVWPEFTLQEVADELILEIESGSSGRPNRATEIQNFERMAPLLMQIPGISPEWLAREAIKRLDDRIDYSSAIAAGAQAIIAQNAIQQQQQVAMTNAALDPAAQGGEGANTQARPGTGEATQNMMQNQNPTGADAAAMANMPI